MRHAGCGRLAASAPVNENVEPESQVGLFATESLILAQNERWRHGLGMQVERGAAMRPVAKG